MKHFLISIFFLSTIASAQTALITDTNYLYRSLSVALEHPELVYRLNLSKHKLKTIPPDILKLKNLRELDLSRNKIDSIPKEIGTFKQLTHLNLSHNEIVMLPDEIGELVSLKFLGLNRNLIEALPATIGNLEQLEVLELWDNELSTIPEEITKCKNLKVLELRGILFSDEDYARIDTMLPDTKVYLSPACNCK